MYTVIEERKIQRKKANRFAEELRISDKIRKEIAESARTIFIAEHRAIVKVLPTYNLSKQRFALYRNLTEYVGEYEYLDDLAEQIVQL